MKGVSSQAELMESIKRFGVSAQDLMNQVNKIHGTQKMNFRIMIIISIINENHIAFFVYFIQAAKRQYELKDPAMRDNLAAARAVLKKHSMMLLTASKAYVRHPELAAAKANRDFVLRQVRKRLF